MEIRVCTRELNGLRLIYIIYTDDGPKYLFENIFFVYDLYTMRKLKQEQIKKTKSYSVNKTFARHTR